MTTISSGNEHPSAFEAKGISRREFLFYLGGTSAALFAAGTCGGVYWFTQQRITYGRDSGVFRIDVQELPTTPSSPVFLPEAESWLVLTDGGLIALNARCVYDNYIFRWVDNNQRYECPACGSKDLPPAARIAFRWKRKRCRAPAPHPPMALRSALKASRL